MREIKGHWDHEFRELNIKEDGLSGIPNFIRRFLGISGRNICMVARFIPDDSEDGGFTIGPHEEVLLPDMHIGYRVADINQEN